MKIINSVDDNINLLSKINKLQESTQNSNSGEFSNNELDGRVNILEGRIKKLNSDFEKANLDEFKEKIESKLDLLEEVSSKNAAIPTDLSYRIDGIEDKIRIINNTNSIEISSTELKELNKKVLLLEEQIQNNKNTTEDKSENNDLFVEIEKIESRLNVLENKEISNPTNSVSEELLNRVSDLEKMILELSYEQIPVDNEEFKNEINELKENYFVLIKAIQNQGTVSNVSNNVNNEPLNNSNNAKLEMFVDELLANVNRLSMKLQESNNELNVVNEKVKLLEEKDNINNDTINQIIAHVDEISSEIKNDIYDAKLIDIDNKITGLEKNNSEIKQEISKLKQVPNYERKTTVEKPVVKEMPNTNSLETKVYVTPKEEPKVVVSNDNNTLQTIKNVYDVRIIERILHEARSLECREEKMRLVNSWPKLEDKVGYVLAPIAKILRDGKMVANGKKEILIVYPTATICNHLMETKNYIDAKQVLRITFGKDFDFLALPENTWQEKRSEYVGQIGVGITYPKLTPINNPELNVVMVNYNQVNNEVKKPLQQARAFFKNVKVEEERK